mgnify:CR=1 FL=1
MRFLNGTARNGIRLAYLLDSVRFVYVTNISAVALETYIGRFIMVGQYGAVLAGSISQA